MSTFVNQIKTISIVTPYITIGQFLKLADLISSGGFAKAFLSEAIIYVNGVLDNRRGRKLYPNDKVEHQGQTFLIVAA